ncbi:alpha-glucosidase [Kineococcus xinjiangensis]|uniref:Alpha-glucosidase n=1 Tax=Kineococcus xinjiangensis TaxID=512762 RepID=A0A2S6IDY2_9ACTN|nr:glycoside hydrolase family 13 protein [Kineococcus xinjiangensis]PPK92428.1 alpha-glucosidase [Kineococcus xinjiangensis]
MDALLDVSTAPWVDLHPVHPATPGAEWWRTAVVYQVYPRSFADSDGDGIGDLPGITSRLEHLAELGVDAVWISPFYRSPQVDAGYDVADYRDIDPLFGTLTDFDDLLGRAHSLGLRIIIDLVPNHTSDEHAWFRQALAAAPGSAERGRYIFRPGRGAAGELPPNNWKSIFGGPAWTRTTGPDGEPGEWYLHMFDSRQPDLDWSNPEVHEEFESILRFWLDRGVDGFRVDVAHGLVKADGLPDWSGYTAMVEGSRDSGTGPMFDQEGVHEIYRSWRRLLDTYPGQRVLVAEAWIEHLPRIARYVRPDEMHQAFNFTYLTSRWDAEEARQSIIDSLEASDAVGAPTTWVLSNHDVVRHASRFGLSEAGSMPKGIAASDEQPDEELGLRRARAATLQMLALPGAAYLYQGEELGLPDHTTMPDEVRQDPAWFRTADAGSDRETGRDGCRVPLPWSAAEPGFGFSPTGSAWLPQPEGYGRYALDAQRGVAGSTYELYRQAVALRRHLGLASGGLDCVELADTDPSEVVALRNREVLVITAYGPGPVVLPAGSDVLLASDHLGTDARGRTLLPPDTTAWILPPTQRLPRARSAGAE